MMAGMIPLILIGLLRGVRTQRSLVSGGEACALYREGSADMPAVGGEAWYCVLSGYGVCPLCAPDGGS
jgi:hypothetical protein